ncbi:MAG TPA: restriction endonuclease subunit S [Mycobacteriales bacterium]|nr:restriction endonuclease subunit S [Mycobacteriales bacterium]
MTPLPEDWREVALADLGTWYGGGTPSKARPDFWAQGTIPWLSPKDMGGDVVCSTQDRITEAAVTGSAVRRVPAGSVALVVRSGILERTLPIAVVPIETTLNQDMRALVPWDGVDPRWIAWVLRSREQGLLRRCRKAGTTVASIETKRLLAEKLVIPPIDEQLRIIEILEDQLSRLDAAQRLTEQAVRRLSRLRDTAAQSALAEARASSVEVQLGDLAEPNRKIAYGVLVPGPHVDDGVPLIRVGDLQDGRIDATAMKRISPAIAGRFQRTFVTGGEVLLSLVGTIGRTAVVPPELAGANVARAVGVLPLAPDAQPDFVSTILSAPEIQRLLNRQAHEVARKTLNLEDVRRLAIPLPGRVEQLEIMDRYRATLDALHRLSVAAEVTLVRARSLQRSLLAAACSGQLAVHTPDLPAKEGLASV